MLSRIAIGFVASFVPYGVLTAQDTGWIDNVADQSANFLEMTASLLVLLAFALFIWGMVVFIASSGSDDGREEGRKRMLWGLIALVVLCSVWGLVVLLQVVFGVSFLGADPVAPGVELPSVEL